MLTEALSIHARAAICAESGAMDGQNADVDRGKALTGAHDSLTGQQGTALDLPTLELVELLSTEASAGLSVDTRVRGLGYLLHRLRSDALAMGNEELGLAWDGERKEVASKVARLCMRGLVSQHLEEVYAV